MFVLANATKTWGVSYVDTCLRYPVQAFTNTRTVQRDTGSTVAVLEPGHDKYSFHKKLGLRLITDNS